MIDWLTLRLPPDRVSEELRLTLLRLHGKLISINPDGSIEWEAPRRESVRSDSHQVTVHMGYGLEISGSPARVMHTNNAFGSGDILHCFSAMLGFVEKNLGVHLPASADVWKCSRVDITHNFDLGSHAEVRQALSCLRLSEGGHFQVRTQSESVYWGQGSRLRRGKAYAKGPHLRYLAKKKGLEIEPDLLDLADKLLRLELTLAGQYWRERATKNWYEHTEEDLDALHKEYFDKVIGKLEVKEMDNIQERFEEVAATPGQGKAAYRTWALIRSIGIRETQAMLPVSTWHRHKKIMFDAGLTWADLQSQNVVPFRQRAIVISEPVRSWADLRRAA
jgi:II/X family phage/plasmid replication protein